MTEESYQRNVRRGLTGRNTATCLPASLDRVSLYHSLNPRTYDAYEELFWDFQCMYDPGSLVGRWRDLWRQICRELGVLTLRNITSGCISHQSQLEAYLAKLIQSGFRISLSVKNNHAVGVLPVENRPGLYQLRSTWSPFVDDIATPSELMGYLNRKRQSRLKQSGQSTRKKYKFANVISLPPERKR